jgi:hypothetical protein
MPGGPSEMLTCVWRKFARVQLEGNENDLPSLPCIKSNTARTLAVQSKSHEDTIRIPYSCAYTTVDTVTIKELGIYEWWLTQAIPRASNRYALTRKLVRLIMGKADTVLIPLPDNQQIGFDLHPITLNVQVRFA